MAAVVDAGASDGSANFSSGAPAGSAEGAAGVAVAASSSFCFFFFFFSDFSDAGVAAAAGAATLAGVTSAVGSSTADDFRFFFFFSASCAAMPAVCLARGSEYAVSKMIFGLTLMDASRRRSVRGRERHSIFQHMQFRGASDWLLQFQSISGCGRQQRKAWQFRPSGWLSCSLPLQWTGC